MSHTPPNISRREQFVRRITGWAFMALTVLIAELMYSAGYPRWYRTGLFFTVFIGILGFMQASAGT